MTQLPFGNGNGIKRGFLGAVTNEYTLLLYRVVTAGCALLMSWWLLDLRDSTKDLRRDISVLQLSEEARISKIEGQISVIDAAIRMQTKSIESNDITIQTLWLKMYEMNGRPPDHLHR